MAKRSDIAADLSEARQKAEEAGPIKRRAEYHAQRRVEALSLRLAGLSYEQIGDRLGISEMGAYDMVKRALERSENPNVEEMRQIENLRLDRAQAAIWPDVLKGDQRAISTYLSISSARARINGMNAPTNINLSVGVRTEMENALDKLEELVMEAEVVEDAEIAEDEEPQDPQELTEVGFDEDMDEDEHGDAE